MNFALYEKNFIAEAKQNGKSDEYINQCLVYAKKLDDQDLPVIYDVHHFGLLVGIDPSFILMISNKQNKFYRYFNIPKSNGKKRKIAEPLPVLKEIQYYILHNILYKKSCSIYTKAYKPGSTLKGNARFHRDQPVLVKLDIKDYFPSLHESRVYKFFNEYLGYNKAVSVVLTKLCTLKGGLPQGAPTSPYLSNLLTADMDMDIYSFCSRNGNLRYTRSADDISISGAMDTHNIISGVSKIVSDHGLCLNKDKTAVIKQHSSQIVTGIVVNKKLQAPKAYRKTIRLEMYYCQKYGILNHLKKRPKEYEECDIVKYCQSMLGKVNYCLQLNNNDAEMKRYQEYLITQLKNAKR